MGVFKRKIRRKDGSVKAYWYARLNVNGRDTWKSLGEVGIVTKGQAQAIFEELKRHVRLGQFDIISANIPTLHEFSHHYLEYIRDVKQNRSWKSTQLYLEQLKKFFGTKKLFQITPKDIDDYKLRRLKEVKPASVNRELACLSHLFNYAKRQKAFFGENPVATSKLLPEHNQVERILTQEEEQRLLNSSSPELKPIIICALNTGMRKGEILTLKWSNVDLEKNVITLEHTNTKSKKTRKIPVNSTLRRVLLEQKLKTGNGEYVFLNSKGKPYKKHDSLNQAFRGACRRAGIKGLRFHDLYS